MKVNKMTKYLESSATHEKRMKHQGKTWLLTMWWYVASWKEE